MPEITHDQIDQRTAKIERMADKETLGELTISTQRGMIEYKTATEVTEMAKVLSSGGPMLPAHLRNNPGACALTLMQAIKWRLDFSFVASQQYLQNDRINYQSQIFRAIMENSGMLQGRMKQSYSGEGDERRCKVWATFKGDEKPTEHESPPLKQVRPPVGDKGFVKGSPLWTKKPDVQLLYDTQRDWVRINAPEIFGGIYDPDEITENEDQMKVVGEQRTTPERTMEGLKERLARSRQEAAAGEGVGGFNVQNVHQEIDKATGAAPSEPEIIEPDKPAGRKGNRSKVVTDQGDKVETKPEGNQPVTLPMPQTEAEWLKEAARRGAIDGADKAAADRMFLEQSEAVAAEYQKAYTAAYPAEPGVPAEDEPREQDLFPGDRK